MNILVAGGSGFLGSELVRALMAERAGGKVHVLSRSGSGVAGAVPVRCDLSDGPALRSVVSKIAPREIYHVAGIPPSGKDSGVPEHFAGNTVTTANLLRAASELSAETRFFLASSVAVYGDIAEPVAEAEEPRPSTPFAFSKYLAERTVQQESGNVRVVVGRLGNCLGPGQPEGHPISELCRRLLSAAAKGQAITVDRAADLQHWIDVRDAAVAIVRLVAGCEPGVETYNIASRESLRVREVVETLGKSLGLEASLVQFRDDTKNRPSASPIVTDKLVGRLSGFRARAVRASLEEIAKAERK